MPFSCADLLFLLVFRLGNAQSRSELSTLLGAVGVEINRIYLYYALCLRVHFALYS